MENQNYHELLYQRAKEVQPHIKKIVSNCEKDGLTPDDTLIEVSFALIHEGYRLRELKDGVKLKAEQHTTTHKDSI